MTPKISLIVAVAQNGIIGTGGTMPWHITEDFRHFKEITLGHSVIMGGTGISRKELHQLRGK